VQEGVILEEKEINENEGKAIVTKGEIAVEERNKKKR
jgi:hypothetical protein